MPTYRMTIAYQGTQFHGWQRQFVTDGSRTLPRSSQDPAHATPEPLEPRPELRTVQGAVREAVRSVVNQPVEVQGASRTDAGVHALAQCAAFTVEGEGNRPPDDRLARALNARLPDDVLITECVRTHDGFDPIGDCVRKGYRYTILAGPMRPLWNRATAWHTFEAIDPARMNEAAAHLVGTHDFASFAAANHGRESTVRTIFGCTVTAGDVRTFAPECANADPERPPTLAHIDVWGDGFLYNMVRIIAGTLLDVGRGRWSPDDVPTILDARDRAAAGPTLGPEGLRLEWIDYGSFACGGVPR